MYKTASQYLGINSNHIMEPYKNIHITNENFLTHPPHTSSYSHTSSSHTSSSHTSTHSLGVTNNNTTPSQPHLTYKTESYPYLSDPRVWGPPFWFSLHTSAINYPVKPSMLFRQRMKDRILAIPYEIPCSACKPHAAAFIEKYKSKLDQIVSSRDSLFNFYVDFHNQVNKRYNKKIWTYDQAKKYYSGGAKVTSMTY